MFNSLLENTLNLDTGVYILLVIFAFLLFVGISIFLVFRIRRDRNRLIAEKYKIKELDRFGFEELLRHKYEIANEDTHFSVFLIRIDGVEELKTSLGERQVKKIILTLRERIIRVIPHGSKICDFAEDELAIYIEENMDNLGLTNVALVTISECNKPIMLLTRTKIQMNINIGIAGNNEISRDATSLLQNLELALSNSAAAGLNKFEIYSEELAEQQTEQYKKYLEIKEAIKNQQFTLFFQPIVRLQDNKVIGYETLVRWQHPTLGTLTPDKFLPIMEQTGDINWIGTWAFEQMLRLQTKHYREHPAESDVIFALNLSPKQLMYPHLAEEFRKVYKRYHIPAKNIVLEIVEFSMYDKIAEVASNVLKLTQMGYQIAVDDFGLEMSSMKNLEELTFDWVKLDRKFIDKSQDDFLIGSMVETLVAFAERKNFKVVAEGIEDEVIYKYVKGLKIGYGQGYYYGKPLPPEEYKI